MMRAKWVPAARTVVSPADVVAAYRYVCLDLWDTKKPETIATLVAQSALETGRWASMFNYCVANVKAGSTYEGLYCCIKLNEVEIRDGKRTTVWYDPALGELLGKNGPPRYPNSPYRVPEGHFQCRMRAYESLRDGVASKLKFLNGRRYAAAKQAALAGDAALYYTRCGEAGYYTADRVKYTRGAVSLFKTYLPMAQQQVAAPAPLPPADENQLCQDMADCMRTEIPDWLKRHLHYLVNKTMVVDWNDWQKHRDSWDE